MLKLYPKTPEQEITLAKMLDYLSRRDYSAKKLASKLLDLKKRYPKYKKYQAFTENNIADSLEYLKQNKILNEERALRNMAEASLSSSYGLRRLKLKMLRREYPRQLIETIIKEFEALTHQKDLSKIIRLTKNKKSLLEKKYSSDPKKLKTIRQRLVAFLAQRGFDFDQISEILEKTKEN